MKYAEPNSTDDKTFTNAFFLPVSNASPSVKQMEAVSYWHTCWLSVWLNCSNSLHNKMTKKKTYLEDLRHLSLLWKGAVVLYGQDDGHVRIDKCSPVNCFHHILGDERRDLILRKITSSQICNDKSQLKPILMRFSMSYSFSLMTRNKYRRGNKLVNWCQCVGHLFVLLTQQSCLNNCQTQWIT